MDQSREIGNWQPDGQEQNVRTLQLVTYSIPYYDQLLGFRQIHGRIRSDRNQLDLRVCDVLPFPCSQYHRWTLPCREMRCSIENKLCWLGHQDGSRLPFQLSHPCIDRQGKIAPCNISQTQFLLARHHPRLSLNSKDDPFTRSRERRMRARDRKQSWVRDDYRPQRNGPERAVQQAGRKLREKEKDGGKYKIGKMVQ